MNVGNITKNFNWGVSHIIPECEIDNKSERIYPLAVHVPLAIEILQKSADVNLSLIKFYSFVTAKFSGYENVLTSNTGCTGVGGFELYFNAPYSKNIWSAIFEVGKYFGIKSVGLGARDNLRFGMGYCICSNDIDYSKPLIEVGLSRTTKLIDGKNLISKEFLLNQKKNGEEHRLVALVMSVLGIPRESYIIFNNQNEKSGYVTSSTISPALKQGIGMGYINSEYASVGTDVFIEIRGCKNRALISKPPFRKI